MVEITDNPCKSPVKVLYQEFKDKLQTFVAMGLIKEIDEERVRSILIMSCDISSSFLSEDSNEKTTFDWDGFLKANITYEQNKPDTLTKQYLFHIDQAMPISKEVKLDNESDLKFFMNEIAEFINYPDMRFDYKSNREMIIKIKGHTFKKVIELMSFNSLLKYLNNCISKLDRKQRLQMFSDKDHYVVYYLTPEQSSAMKSIFG